MSKLISIGLSPNCEPDDVKLSLKLLLSPSTWLRGGATEKLEMTIAKYFGQKYVFAFESGRSSLLSILKSLPIAKGSEVLIQAYTCVAVPNSVIWAGYKPVYVDIDKEFNMSLVDLKRKITKKSKALIIQHTFGTHAKIEEIVKIAKEKGILVVEDCAHALGAEYKGKKLGTFGDAAIFSFGRDKVISSVFGGVVATNDQKLAKSVLTIQNEAKEVSINWLIHQLAHPTLTQIIKESYRVKIFAKVLMKTLKQLKILSKAVTPEEKRGEIPNFVLSKMPNALSLLALNQFKKLDRFNRTRKELARFYVEELKNVSLIKLPPYNPDSVYLRLTVLSKDAKEIINFAKSKNVFLGDWYRTPIAPGGVELNKIFYKKDSCPTAQKTAKMTLNLPTNPNLTIADAKYVANVLKEFNENSSKKS